MDPTIYTMGDPMIVREALFALAAIFNSADWFNAGNGFGMGGYLSHPNSLARLFSTCM